MSQDQMSNEALSDLLSLVGAEHTPEEIDCWTDYMRHEAEKWAAKEHLYASDNRVYRWSKPTFIQTKGTAK